jgi:MYXO-CTERM domain-containing protein
VAAEDPPRGARPHGLGQIRREARDQPLGAPGDSAQDKICVGHTELVSGYGAGLYDVLIEIYDADTGELVDEYGPNESSEFSLLPLEDAGRDGVPPPPPEDHSGGGAISWLGLGGLLGVLALRRRRITA